MNEPEDGKEAEFEARARALLEESVTHVDGHVRSRLNQARQAAVGLAEKRRVPWRGRAVLPLGLATAAAVALVAVVTWHQHTVRPLSEDDADIELIADSEAFELLADDDSFYEWAVSQESGG